MLSWYSAQQSSAIYSNFMFILLLLLSKIVVHCLLNINPSNTMCRILHTQLQWMQWYIWDTGKTHAMLVEVALHHWWQPSNKFKMCQNLQQHRDASMLRTLSLSIVFQVFTHLLLTVVYLNAKFAIDITIFSITQVQTKSTISLATRTYLRVLQQPAVLG